MKICISNTEASISADIRLKIHDPLFAPKDVGMGTGRELAICQAPVVTAHGGAILFNAPMGKETMFLIRLPLDGACQESKAA